MPDIVEAWMWRNPEEIIERLLAVSDRPSRRPVIELPAGNAPMVRRDRYYTAWRRLHVKQLMRARR